MRQPSRCPADGARSSISCATAAQSRAGTQSIAAFLPPPASGAFAAAGSAAGKMLLSECLADGAARGAREGAAPAVPQCRDEAFAITPLWWVKESTGKAFVDFQNDATADDLLLAHARASPTSNSPNATPRPAWRPTRANSATSTRSLSLAEATGKSIEQVGTTTFRPLLHAGRVRRARRAVRRPPFPAGAQDAAARLGRRTRRGLRRNRLVAALGMVPARRRGLAGQRHPRGPQHARTCRHLRCLDARQDRRAGQDAGAFLDRLYCNTFSTLPSAARATA